ncbi:serine hydrolase domain-containing protein [Muricoccus radiodurans]|uniref:serine hydrolase domain-containing protein n=1 Tax=Muricoccus radiodurans TaxID=2231721 RepID=UPI003CF6DBC0
MLHRRDAITLAGGAAMAGLTGGPAAQAQTVTTSAATPASLPRAGRAEEVGLSTERLTRIGGWLREEVAANRIPGAVVVVARKGRIAHEEAVGFRDRESGAAMPVNAVFRIASMTKPFASLALMMLVEEGKVMLWHPVSRYLPEFGDQAVGMERTAVQRPPTVQDLMRHTSGLTSAAGEGVTGADPVQRAYAEANVANRNQTSAQFITGLARMPLMYQPGTHWEYGHSTDVVGRIVEVVSGMDLDAFIKARISGPLGLRDTGFWAPAEAGDRAAKAQVDPVTNRRQAIPDALQKPNWFSGGGGMVSTAQDYARFCQMLLNGGTLDGTRIVSPKTIELMTSNHLPPGTEYSPGLFARFGGLAPSPTVGYGFGLGFAVRLEQGRSPVPGSIGDYSWGGAYGTYFWVDPKEELFAVLMLQGPSDRLQYRYGIRQLVYQAFA